MERLGLCSLELNRYLNALDPELKEKKWTVQNEEELFQLQRKHGNRWADLTKVINGRSENTIKNHFYVGIRKSIVFHLKTINLHHLIPLVQIMKPLILSKILELNYKEMPPELNGVLPNAAETSTPVSSENDELQPNAEVPLDCHRYIFKIFIPNERLERMIIDHAKVSSKSRGSSKKRKLLLSKAKESRGSKAQARRNGPGVLRRSSSKSQKGKVAKRKGVAKSKVNLDEVQAQEEAPLLQKRISHFENEAKLPLKKPQSQPVAGKNHEEQPKSETESSLSGFQKHKPEKSQHVQQGFIPCLPRPEEGRQDFPPNPNSHFISPYGFHGAHHNLMNYFPYLNPYYYFGSPQNHFMLQNMGRPQDHLNSFSPKETSSRQEQQHPIQNEVLNKEVGKCLIEKLTNLIEEIKGKLQP